MNTIFDSIKTVLEADASLTAELKEIYIQREDYYSNIVQSASPSIVLNDGGESYMPVGEPTIDGGNLTRLKIKVYNVSLICVVKYAKNGDVLVGNANFIGLVNFSHLVEDALKTNKTINNNYILFEMTGWIPVDIINPDDRRMLFAVGREMTVSYKEIKEV